jgi:hypothetical protein
MRPPFCLFCFAFLLPLPSTAELREGGREGERERRRERRRERERERERSVRGL